MKIYKDDVLEALYYEPLLAGIWRDSSTCRACAVGATLIVAGFEAPSYGIFSRRCSLVTKSRFSWGDIDTNLETCSWLSYLSMIWEYLCRTIPIEKARYLLIEIVEDLFPEDEDLTQTLQITGVEVA